MSPQAEDKTTLLIIKGTIAELPAEDQAKVEQLAEQLRALIKENGERGFLAIALVGAELAVEAHG